jgi:hypothetical protein
MIRSSMRGISSVPLIRAADTSWYGMREIRPRRSVTRSRVRSWKASRIPSWVARVSVSRWV